MGLIRHTKAKLKPTHPVCVHCLTLKEAGGTSEIRSTLQNTGSIASPDPICLYRVLVPFHILSTSSRICKAHGELYHQASAGLTEREKKSKPKFHILPEIVLSPLVPLPRWQDVFISPENKRIAIEKSNATRRKWKQCKLPVVLCMLFFPPLISICKTVKWKMCL